MTIVEINLYSKSGYIITLVVRGLFRCIFTMQRVVERVNVINEGAWRGGVAEQKKESNYYNVQWNFLPDTWCNKRY